MSHQVNTSLLKLQIPLDRVYDLGKWCFAASTAALTFISAAEKFGNKTTSPWQWGSSVSFASLLLFLATVLPAAMVIGGAPSARAAPSNWQTWTVAVWFVIWVVGAVLGLWAVLYPRARG